jgi:RimJ/RimL family protein N-acetyltransferase
MIPRKLINDLDKENLILHFTKDIVDEDRRLRFGAVVDDDSIIGYLNNSFKEFGCKNMWFILDTETPTQFDRRVIASCHVSYDEKTNCAEMGCTVSPEFRDQKIGQELFNRGITWARMRGAETVFMHCLSENKTIQHIAKKNGMTVVTIDPLEKESTIKVNKNPIVAGFEDAVMEQMAVYDMSVRNQKWFFTSFLKLMMRYDGLPKFTK